MVIQDPPLSPPSDVVVLNEETKVIETKVDEEIEDGSSEYQKVYDVEKAVKEQDDVKEYDEVEVL